MLLLLQVIQHHDVSVAQSPTYQTQAPGQSFPIAAAAAAIAVHLFSQD